MGCNNNCGIFGGNNDWVWVIIVIVIFLCLCDNGIFGNDCDRDRC
ncbi:MAG: hypothetical protein BWY15_00235 [Firmicutes bacterium ADurb.Bin193]|nr:MAG: hypothetical protein BWY15_00235 [Firmicutes bacterium ADurb.Bin193]